MTTPAQRQRHRRRRLREQGLAEVTVRVPADQRDRIQRLADALTAGLPVSPRLIRALAVLRGERDELARLGADRAGIFGSVARGDDGPASDIDVVLTFTDPESYDPYRLIAMRRTVIGAFEAVFPDTGVEVSFYPMMRGPIQKAVDAEAVYAD